MILFTIKEILFRGVREKKKEIERTKEIRMSREFFSGDGFVFELKRRWNDFNVSLLKIQGGC